MKCDCIDHSIKLHIEGALIHYIRKIQEDVATFAKEAEFFKVRNPNLSNNYSEVAKSQNAFIEKLEDAKRVIMNVPECGVKEGNPYPRRLSVPEQHQLKIAKDTLRMPDAMARVMGGPTKEQAREIIKELTGKEAKDETIRSL